jgi:hypothetical protein
MVAIPGQFMSFGHDYRADTADFVQTAYELPEITEEQMAALHDTLVTRELDRAARIKAGKELAQVGSMGRVASDTQ